MSQFQGDVMVEQVALSTGQKVTVYRCPYPSEGPVEVRTQGSEVVLKYMYAHFVFTWPRGTTRVQISHGTLDRSMLLWSDQPIEGEWSARNLTRFGRTWTRRHLDRCKLP